MTPVMLAADMSKWTDSYSVVPTPLYLSHKIDGIRAYTDGAKLISRTNKPIVNRHIQQSLAFIPPHLDGELVAWDASKDMPHPYNVTSSLVMAADAVGDFRYLVFDMVSKWPTPFVDRYNAYKMTVSSLGNPNILAVDQRWATSWDAVVAYEASALDQGWEGIMLRKPDGTYKFGRSSLNEFHLVKLKRFVDDEATIIDTIEQTTNTNAPFINERGYTERSSLRDGLVPNGHLGVLVCLHPKFGRVEIGGGALTIQQRRDLWLNRANLVGKRVKFKHQYGPTSGYTNARSPQFIGFAED